MNGHIFWGSAAEFFLQHWVSAFFLSLTLLTVSILLMTRWWLRRKWAKILDAEYSAEIALDVQRPLSDQDKVALELVKSFREEMWRLRDHDLQLSIEALSQKAVRIVRSVAAVYHPQAEIPEYEASLTELVQLVQRTAMRLTRMGTIGPFRLLTQRKISDYQKFYQIYQKINDSSFLKLLQRHRYLYRMARWAINLKNLGNPLYWAGREISRESYFFLMRWFYAAFVGQVGREAIRLYSGRHFKDERSFEAAMACFRLFSLTREWNGPSSSEWKTLVDLLINCPFLDTDSKLQMLSHFARNQIPDSTDAELRDRLVRKWYGKGLERLLDSESETSPTRTELINRELDGLGDGVRASKKSDKR